MLPAIYSGCHLFVRGVNFCKWLTFGGGKLLQAAVAEVAILQFFGVFDAGLTSTVSLHQSG